MSSKVKAGFSVDWATHVRLRALSFALGRDRSAIVEDGVARVVANLDERQRTAFAAACAATGVSSTGGGAE